MRPVNEPVTRAEFRRHDASQLEVLRQRFVAEPLKLLPAPWLADEAHTIALHSRIADLRKKYGMTVCNKMSKVYRNGVATPVSHYYYVPPGATDPFRPAPVDPEAL